VVDALVSICIGLLDQLVSDKFWEVKVLLKFVQRQVILFLSPHQGGEYLRQVRLQYASYKEAVLLRCENLDFHLLGYSQVRHNNFLVHRNYLLLQFCYVFAQLIVS